MTEHNAGRFARVRRHAIAAAVTAALPVAMLGAASPAMAETHHPKGDFAVFADCPLSNPQTSACIYAQTKSGEFIVGKSTVPIKNTITLQGGIHASESGAETFIGAEDGNTLSKTPQAVPGGLAGFVECYKITEFFERVACELTFQNGVTGVNATTELAAPASSIEISVQNLVDESGTALSLPVKVHLENPFLGSGCYIGSNSHPINIPLTTGTTSPPAPNKPIKGAQGTIEFKDEFKILSLTENALVNNSFAAPEAEGCGGLLSFLIDPIIDSKLGLPASAGHNTAILKGTLEQSTPAYVKASE